MESGKSGWVIAEASPLNSQQRAAISEPGAKSAQTCATRMASGEFPALRCFEAMAYNPPATSNRRSGESFSLNRRRRSAIPSAGASEGNVVSPCSIAL